jgi:hypothetical protein
MLRLPTAYCIKTAHPQRVDVAIRKIPSVEDGSLVTDVRSANGGMDATDRYEVLRGPSVGTVKVLERYRVSSTALVPYLQL